MEVLPGLSRDLDNYTFPSCPMSLLCPHHLLLALAAATCYKRMAKDQQGYCCNSLALSFSGLLLSVLERFPWDTVNPVPPPLSLMKTEDTSKGVVRSGEG